MGIVKKTAEHTPWGQALSAIQASGQNTLEDLFKNGTPATINGWRPSGDGPFRKNFNGNNYNWNSGLGLWTLDTSGPAPAAAPAVPDMASIFGDAKNYAEKTVPTGDVWANALMDSINTMGQGTLEQFNARGQGVNSGIFTDALAKNATSMTTQSQLDQSKLLSDTMANYFTGDKAQYYDQWKTQYQGDLAKYMNQQNVDAYTKALAEMKKNKKNNAVGSLIGTGVGAVAGSVVPGLGTLAGAQVGAGVGGAAGNLWSSD